jgi:hypothetical protein
MDSGKSTHEKGAHGAFPGRREISRRTARSKARSAISRVDDAGGFRDARKASPDARKADREFVGFSGLPDGLPREEVVF